MIRGTLNRIFRSGTGSRTKRGWRCPDETELAAFIDAQVSSKAGERVRHHLADCRYCRDQVAAVVRLQSGAEVPSDVPPGLLARARALAETKERGQAMPALRWGAVAAVAASIAVVVAVTYRQPPSPPTLPLVQPAPRLTVSPALPPVAAEPPTVRNLQNVAAAPELLYPRDGGVVPSTGIEFRWKHVPTALSYDVRVVTDDGNVVWEGRAEDSQIVLPSSIHLTPGESFYVRVSANLPEGKTVTARVVGFKVKNSS